MDELVIRVEGLGKRYRIGARTARYRTLRETLVDAAASPLRRMRAASKNESSSKSQNLIWALRDVSFEVHRGQVLGIIGGNGAGKTTLLRVLSRITKPTKGVVDLYGRVGSLLEVGTGFHPELTGRENIYLNGAILGMRRSEIDRRFDEIVSFAEIDRFLDTPVKRYSSGMYVRLAFSVAAHMEPDILLIDEVLAVGDARFQRKCLSMMEEVTREGRTVVFVSHDMSAMSQLCETALLLQDGRIVKRGLTEEVIVRYLDSSSTRSTGALDVSDLSWRIPQYSSADSQFKWRRITLLNSKRRIASDLKFGEPFELLLDGTVTEPLSGLQTTLGLRTATGTVLFNSWGGDEILRVKVPAGDIRVRVKFEPNYLAPGTYEIDIGADGPNIQDVVGPFKFGVLATPFNARHIWESNHRGIVANPCVWSFDDPSEEDRN